MTTNRIEEIQAGLLDDLRDGISFTSEQMADTLADIAAAMNHALRRHSQPVRPADEYRDLVGEGVRRLGHAANATSAEERAGTIRAGRWLIDVSATSEG